MAIQKLAFLNGYFDIYDRDENGNPVNGFFLGDVSESTLNTEVEKQEHKESYSGQNLTIATVTTGKPVSLQMTLHNHQLEVLAPFLQSEVVATAGATATDEDLGDLAAGQVTALKNLNISSVTTITKDVAGTPTAAVEGIDYALDKKTARFVAISAMEGVKVTYVYGARKSLGIFAGEPKEKFLRYNATNKVDGKPYVFILRRVKANPLQNFSLVGQQIAGYNVTFDILADDKLPGGMGGNLGALGHIECTE